MNGNIVMRLECPSCGQSIEVNTSASGQKFGCPTCGNSLVVPSINPQKYVRKVITSEWGLAVLVMGVLGFLPCFLSGAVPTLICLAVIIVGWNYQSKCLCSNCGHEVDKHERGCIFCSSNFSN